jgi:hypothetical protein
VQLSRHGAILGRSWVQTFMIPSFFGCIVITYVYIYGLFVMVYNQCFDSPPCEYRCGNIAIHITLYNGSRARPLALFSPDKPLTCLNKSYNIYG